MAEKHTTGVPSRAAIRGHPIHPALVPFPIAFLIGAFFTDVAFSRTHSATYAEFSFWLIAAGVVMSIAAAAAGLTDFVSIERARMHAAGWIHAGGNVAMLVISIINLALRWSDHAAPIIPTGIILSAVTTVILGVTGWFGGELVFRHMIGVTGHGHGEGAGHEKHELQMDGEHGQHEMAAGVPIIDSKSIIATSAAFVGGAIAGLIVKFDKNPKAYEKTAGGR